MLLVNNYTIITNYTTISSNLVEYYTATNNSTKYYTITSNLVASSLVEAISKYIPNSSYLVGCYR